MQVESFKLEPNPFNKWVKWVDPFTTQTRLSSVQTYLRWVKCGSSHILPSLAILPQLLLHFEQAKSNKIYKQP